MRRAGTIFIVSGLVLISFGINILIFTYYPVLLAQVKYLFSDNSKEIAVIGQNEQAPENLEIIRPVDEQFGIVIPKIRANSKIIEGVDPYNSNIYQKALTKGVAHAKNTSTPNKTGNVFLFSHSSVNPLEAARYNSVFYLLTKMEKGDEIYLFYNREKYKYRVLEKRIVNSDEIYYLNNSKQSKTLTLMTCTPPGTTLKRLIVIAELE